MFCYKGTLNEQEVKDRELEYITTKLEQNMEIEALKAAHQAEILKIRGVKTKQEKEEALSKIKLTFHTSAEEYHPRNDNKEQPEDAL